ncbi:MAG: hypothetical protein ABJB12_14110 [Pseudomonadota bacterium]
MGPFHLVIYAWSKEPDGSGTRLDCSIDSATAPNAGDIWALSMADHPGSCTWTRDPSIEGRLFGHQTSVTSTYSSDTPSDSPPSITFVTATPRYGVSNPEDVYYLYDVQLSVGSFSAELLQITLPSCG